jgi:pantoate--beta-alanine ligase
MAPAQASNSGVLVARSIKALRDAVDAWKANGQRVAFVPTMGALHRGHLSLVEYGNAAADRTVASIFVNPKQFAAHEDLSSYPRTEARDLELLATAGCDLAYVPEPAEMYPPGFQTSVSVAELSQGLCGTTRPHFFGGVATVVCKLLNQCRPDVAIFGEKDYQQLLVIRRMARDLDIDVEIAGAPIVREEDGLAMSSRNAYLAKDERAIAAKLNAVISTAAKRLAAGERVLSVLADGKAAIAAAGFSSIDYLEARSALDLTLLGPGPLDGKTPARVFVAVMIGRTRLIDNWPVG